jgi:hypothetical protein
MTKEDDEEEFYSEHDSEARNFNFHLLKADNELFNEEANKASTVTSAKRVKLPKNGEDWHILENGKIALLMKGTRFTNAEKEFLRTVEGMKFLVAEYKSGSKSVVKIKEKMKKLI